MKARIWRDWDTGAWRYEIDGGELDGDAGERGTFDDALAAVMEAAASRFPVRM